MIARIVAAIFCDRDDPDDHMETRLYSFHLFYYFFGKHYKSSVLSCEFPFTKNLA